MKAFWAGLVMVTTSAMWCAQPAAAAEAAEPETIKILGNTYSVVPDDEFRALGFDFPDVAPDENAATYYLKAIEVYVEPARGSGLSRLRDEVMAGRSTDASGELAPYLEDNKQALELIEQAAAHDGCHFPVVLPLGESLDTMSVAEILLRHLTGMREFARLAVVKGKAREYERRYEDALDAHLLALQIGNHAAQGPTLIEGLVGVACNAIGMKAIEECLVRYELDEKTLAMAQLRVHELSKQQPSVMTGMRGERVWSTSIVEFLVDHPERTRDFVGGGNLGQAAWVLMLRSEEGRAQARRDVRAFWDEMEQALELPLSEFIETGAGEEPIRKARARKFPPNIMSALGPALARVRATYGRNEVSWTVLDVEFALARYKAEHGMYPRTLEELKPLMVSDGIDPFSGKPLHYRLEADGAYTIWSVGENLTDEGGAGPERGTRWDGLDFVWSSALIASGD